MSVSYTGLGVAPIGTITCDGDGCTATFHDGIPETEAGLRGGILIRARETAGWRLHRPNEHRADNLCPDCPATYY